MNTQTPPVDVPPRNNENPFAAKAAEEAVRPVKPGPQIITGKKIRPIFCLVGGMPGVGKSTFANGAPNPIFQDLERGTDQLGCDRFPQPANYAEYLEQLDYLEFETHPYRTIVVDTIDALDALITKQTCENLKTDSIEKPSHGAGYTHAKGIWRALMQRFKVLSDRYNIVLISHVSVEPFNDPALPAPYDTWRFRINQKCAAVIKESVDLILYACFNTTVNRPAGEKKGRGLSGDRIFHSQPAPGYEAKNRFNLEDPLPLEWAALREGVKNFYQQK